MVQDSHIFALYSEKNLHAAELETDFSINDEVMAHRIVHVLRMCIGESLILFNKNDNVLLRIQVIEKKTVICRVIAWQKNKNLEPYVVLLLPLLKRDALDAAIYSAVELGVSEIQLIITEKSRKGLLPGEIERLERVVIAAAEQAKYFCFPQILRPISFEQSMTMSFDQKVFFDVNGHSAREMLKNVLSRECKKIGVLVGPEADMSVQEKHDIQKNEWLFCVLMATILRSIQAVALAVGLIRVITHNDVQKETVST